MIPKMPLTHRHTRNVSKETEGFGGDGSTIKVENAINTSR